MLDTILQSPELSVAKSKKYEAVRGSHTLVENVGRKLMYWKKKRPSLTTKEAAKRVSKFVDDTCRKILDDPLKQKAIAKRGNKRDG